MGSGDLERSYSSLLRASHVIGIEYFMYLKIEVFEWYSELFRLELTKQFFCLL